MSDAASKSSQPKGRAGRQGRILGSKAFAAITAVEGLQLSESSRHRLANLKASSLSAEERRAEVVRAYKGLGRKA